MERSDSITLVTLDHFSHFTLKAFGKPLSGAIQSLALWARIFTISENIPSTTEVTSTLRGPAKMLNERVAYAWPFSIDA